MPLALVLLTAVLMVVSAGPASAATTHPLGNFTINHYDGLTLRSDRVDDLAIVDAAEIPTLQERDTVDADHDGTVTSAETAAYAHRQCGVLARALSAKVQGKPLAWRVRTSSFVYIPGAAGLQTSHTTCALTAATSLTPGSQVAFSDGFRSDRIGWREITAVGDGVQLDHPPVPRRSVSRQLRHYPGDLLTSPLDVRSVTLRIGNGSGSSVGVLPHVPSAGMFARAVNQLNSRFDALVAARELTLPVGLLALCLALVLGASHAAMPGHGKTVMAAYLVGRRGGLRDAVIVAATVTLTHTAGVLVLGLLVSGSAALAGESLLKTLGVVSGLLVTAIGIGLLRSAWRARRNPNPTTDASQDAAVPVAAMAVHSPTSHPEHDHGHGHHGHGHGHGHGHEQGRDGRSRRSWLLGLGVAGGLVPSPSALVVLLGAIALGRTGFGVALVLGYGAGMAATLTATGLLLARLSHLLHRVPLRQRAWDLAGYTRIMTAGLVIIVGAGLALRSLNGSV
ncbi:HoxN/HupN/NixA family nickel/cobalt transporter [Actinomadura opuntiae]|uniref:HoxN/HupN/NixA family nickel/cobalt transporter n=1 Tax=Actinomadura sp. OS1-43 TaxID=604315 RepID=UPI00255ABAB5|nr:High-affinity nickel-transporter [Actinomadura sp. OS1-43]MDL4818556.1 High-affinity nickel-transporter [Actinomadura sp. OS1-43]